jgi:hypothetical protein
MQIWGGYKLATFKLHRFACRLADEARVCGATSSTLEFWVERLVQQYKAYVRGRSSWCPSLAFVNDHLTKVRLALLRRSSDASVRQNTRCQAEVTAGALRVPGSQTDIAGEGEAELVGVPVRLSPEEHDTVLHALADLLCEDYKYEGVCPLKDNIKHIMECVHAVYMRRFL